MKKLFILVVLFTTVYVTKAEAQQGSGDPAARAAKMKEMLKPELVEKLKLTEAQADKVLDINFAYRMKMRGLKDLADDDRKKQLGDIQAEQAKEYKAIPLTDDQVKAVNEFFEEQRKQWQKRQKDGNR